MILHLLFVRCPKGRLWTAANRRLGAGGDKPRPYDKSESVR